MRLFIAIVLMAASVHAAATSLPLVRIWEVDNAQGGTYTVDVNSTQSEYSWYLFGFAVTNNDATDAYSSRTGWTGELISEADWNAGRTYSQYLFNGDEIPLFTTGAGGVGSFDDALGLTHHQAAVFWASEYFGNGLGPNGTSSNFHWLEGPPSSTAFAFLTNELGDRLFMRCEVGLTPGACTEYTPTVVPLPAAAWLFLTAIIGLFGVRRNMSGE